MTTLRLPITLWVIRKIVFTEDMIMNMEERIKRINELYHLSQERGLNDEELAEQKRLRKEYIESIRGSLKAQLDNIDIQNADGSIENLGEKYGKKHDIG